MVSNVNRVLRGGAGTPQRLSEYRGVRFLHAHLAGCDGEVQIGRQSHILYQLGGRRVHVGDQAQGKPLLFEKIERGKNIVVPRHAIRDTPDRPPYHHSLLYRNVVPAATQNAPLVLAEESVALLIVHHSHRLHGVLLGHEDIGERVASQNTLARQLHPEARTRLGLYLEPVRPEARQSSINIEEDSLYHI